MTAFSENRTNDTLDNALQHLYDAIRYFEVRLLAIRFEFNGETWEADTVAEAVALRERLERSTRFPVDPQREMSEKERFWTPDRFMDVLEVTGELQQRFLASMLRKPKITSSDLVAELKLDSEVALAGVVSGLSKQLRKLGIEPRQVFSVDVDWTGRTRTRRYILDDFFIAAAMEQNWPEAWEKRKEKDAASTKPKRIIRAI